MHKRQSRRVNGQAAIVTLAAASIVGAFILESSHAREMSAGPAFASIATLGVLLFAMCGRHKISTASAIALGAVVTAYSSLVAVRGVPLLLTVALAMRITWRYGPRNAVAIIAVTTAVGALIVRHFDPLRSPGLGPQNEPFAVGFTACIIFGGFITLAGSVRAEIDARDRLHEAQAELESVRKDETELAVLRERSRIAGELHDALGHSATTALLQVQSANRLRVSNPSQADHFSSAAEAALMEMLAEIRSAVSAVRAARGTYGSDVSLVEKINLLAADINATGRVRVNVLEISAELDSPRALAIFRMTQEALTNIVRHANAEHATIRLRAEHLGIIEYAICDDGRGFDPNRVIDSLHARDDSGGNGLAIMRERIEAAGGTLIVRSAPGAGSCIIARFKAQAL